LFLPLLLGQGVAAPIEYQTSIKVKGRVWAVG